QRKDLQIAFHVPVVRVDPELVEPVRRRECRVEPDRSGFALAELGSRSSRDERSDEPVRVAAVDAPDQVDARGNVAPLIAPAHLDAAMLGAEQMVEIVRLQKKVAGFGVYAAVDELLLGEFL